jgi:hypothetical protein
MAEIHFQSMEASNIESDVTIQFLVGGDSLCRIFPSILFRSKVIQEFHAFEAVKKIFQFLGQYNCSKIFLQISTPAKGIISRKSASIEALWSRWLFRFGL